MAVAERLPLPARALERATTPIDRDERRLMRSVLRRLDASAQKAELPTDVLRDGDLIFSNRDSRPQMYMNVSGDPWTHVGVLVDTHTDPTVVEVGLDGVQTRSLDDFVAAYRLWAVARLRLCTGCRTRFVGSARGHVAAADLIYSKRAVAHLELSALVRRGLPASAERLLNAATIRAVAPIVASVPTHEVTCSGFVELLFDELCTGCRPVPRWPRRARVRWLDGVPHPAHLHSAETSVVATTPTAAAIVRYLTMPSDLWMVERFDFRVVIDEALSWSPFPTPSAPRRARRVRSRSTRKEVIAMQPQPQPQPQP